MSVVEREAVCLQLEARARIAAVRVGNHVFVKRIEWFVQEVAEGYDYENEAERDQCFAYAQTDDQQGAGDEFDKRDCDAGGPERPDGKKKCRRREGSICVRDWAGLTERPCRRRP